MPSDRTRHPWLLPVLLITVLATAAGALAARSVYAVDQRPIDRSAPTTTPGPTPGATPSPSKQPGSPTVGGSADAVEHPLYGTVRQLMQRYFNAINSRNYAAWRTTVVEQRIKDNPEEKWRRDFQSTKDGSIVVNRIELGQRDTAVVLMTFTSTQDPADAPKDLPVGCLRWSIVFPLVHRDDGWKIDESPGSSPPAERCD